MFTTLARVPRTILVLLVALASAAGLFVGATPASASSVCGGTWSQTDSNYVDIGCYLTLMINQERAAHGVHPLSSTGLLRTSATRHDGIMADWNTLSHQLPGEPNLGTRISYAGFNPWRIVGENVAFNTDRTWHGAQYVENLMYNETAPNNGHRLNILNPSFNYVGVNVWMDIIHNKMWIAVDFGTLQ